ncbi:MAG TPA: hypothetical protein VH950_05030 [Gaiellaceae bacterium]|jgi:hypothetical protein
MARQRDPNKGMVVAREAVVVTVGAKPITYEQITVTDRRTGQQVTMDSDRVLDPGSEGIPYAFKQYQRVARSHAAVKTSPGSFIEIDELDDAELELVSS